jgi:hypothetical protein
LPNGHFAERTVWRTDNLTKIEILLNFKGSLTRSKFLWLKSLSILMTETLIVKYSFVFLTSLPKFRDIKNNIIQHHSWMRFRRELWMCSMILEVKFAYVVFIYACLSFNIYQSSAAQTSYQ